MEIRPELIYPVLLRNLLVIHRMRLVCGCESNKALCLLGLTRILLRLLVLVGQGRIYCQIRLLSKTLIEHSCYASAVVVTIKMSGMTASNVLLLIQIQGLIFLTLSLLLSWIWYIKPVAVD